MIRALTFGTFDLLHYGHLRLLSGISQMSDFLAVGLATDELVMAGGKQKPFYSYKIRREMLLHTRYVDEVWQHTGPIDGTGRVKAISQKIEIIQSNMIDLVVMGSDWLQEYDFLRNYCQVVYLDRTPEISTTQIREKLADKIDTNISFL